MTSLPKTNCLDLDLENGWLSVWLNAPEKRHALTEEARAGLKSFFDKAAPSWAPTGGGA